MDFKIHTVFLRSAEHKKIGPGFEAESDKKNNTVFRNEWNQMEPQRQSRTPAATADPITPETFGPMACMSRKF